ncbi:hypothetical protein GW796_09645 [archaeon]|nr:hypothetical protein [archaeon]
MKNTSSDIFTDMKKEDRKFGERGGKSSTAKDHNKKIKHVDSFAKMKPSDIAKMSEEFDLDDLILDY